MRRGFMALIMHRGLEYLLPIIRSTGVSTGSSRKENALVRRDLTVDWLDTLVVRVWWDFSILCEASAAVRSLDKASTVGPATSTKCPETIAHSGLPFATLLSLEAKREKAAG